VVLLGDSGTGKSPLFIGLGMTACEQGRRVGYATAAQLVNELAEAADERRLSRIVARYGRVDLLCLDDSATSSSTPAARNCCSRCSQASICTCLGRLLG
jgi:DNA replication protein DnaC